ncbi:MAG: fibronectin type III domain-containing protein, partial [Gemmatimonadaceae bacterium]|nr:fibronectin type III domain-containing protein [Gemmatimonadaceae bacterium]
MPRLRPLLRPTGVAALLAALAACDSSDNGLEPLGVPTAVTATATSPSRVRVSWNAASGAATYAVLRAAGTGTAAVVGTSATTTFNDSLLTANTTYSYTVRAIRGTDTSAVSQPTQVTTPDRPVRQVTADITASTTWSADTVYQLTRIISVANGAVLTIQAGGRVIGGTISAGSAPPVTALMVLRGSRLVAEGTADRPIVFSSAQAVGDRFPGDWGGLIMV